MSAPAASCAVAPGSVKTPPTFSDIAAAPLSTTVGAPTVEPVGVEDAVLFVVVAVDPLPPSVTTAETLPPLDGVDDDPPNSALTQLNELPR